MACFLISLGTIFLVWVIVASRASVDREKQRNTKRNTVFREAESERLNFDSPPARRGKVARESFLSSRDRAMSSWETSQKPPEWCGRHTRIQIHGFDIRDALTYLGEVGPGSKHGGAVDPSQIDPALRVVHALDAAPLPYWPCYAEMTPEQRYLYLQWLASDRNSLPPGDGFLFVYFYGLERRALVDRTDFDLVFKEVQRLRTLYARLSQTRSRSFQNYSSGLLWYLVAGHGLGLSREHVSAFIQSTKTWTEDSMAAALAWFATREIPLPPWMAFLVAQESPLSQRSVVITRLSEDFRKLFTKRVEAEFGRGLVLRTSKRDRTITYKPASAALQRQVAAVPNPLGVASQFKKLPELWNDCISELRKLSSIIRAGRSEALAEVWEARPSELRSEAEHPHATAIYDLMARSTDESGHTFVRTAELAKVLDIQQRNKLTAKQSRNLATTAEYAGFAIEPDVRMTGQNYGWEDELAAFPHAYEGDPDRARFGGAACMLRLGVEIAEADGEVDDEELQQIMGQIESCFQLNEHERRRLEALRMLLLRTGSDIAGLGKRLQSVMRIDERRTLGRFLVIIAAIDEVITQQELSALRRCFRVLDLPSSFLDTTIAELSPSSDDSPVRISPGQPASGSEEIPAFVPNEGSVTLDRTRIMGIIKESREVSMLLADAMRAQAEQADTSTEKELTEIQPILPPPLAESISPEAGQGPSEVKTGGNGPPSRYAGLFRELIQKERWPRTEAELVARQHGHMLAGALEEINEWAFDHVKGQLVYEDGDCIVIEIRLLEILVT